MHKDFKETFDANSLEWTECAYESNSGTAIIDGGKNDYYFKKVKIKVWELRLPH